jgi:hypothetical protein
VLKILSPVAGSILIDIIWSPKFKSNYFIVPKIAKKQ